MLSLTYPDAPSYDEVQSSKEEVFFVLSCRQNFSRIPAAPVYKRPLPLKTTLIKLYQI